jgi:predicted  nucleic acid-binding Zn-ribbon protein
MADRAEAANLQAELDNARSTVLELEDRLREQERDRGDLADAINGVQAELDQEKSRATDLGVRLQEALLNVDGLRNAEDALQQQVQALQDERSKLLAALSDAQRDTASAQSDLAGVRGELEATAAQLCEARVERDAALRNQSAEAERLMRDHIAEADGDRAVLEHQNLTLTKELEDLRVGAEQKLSAARNAAVRTADGLKAELSFTKAQLRDAQRRESVLSDELAMAKDAQAAMSHKDAHSSDVAKDAVALASRYHETCARLMGVMAASSTISGSISISPAAPATIQGSGLLRSLSTAASFDLDAFADAVNRTIALTKKFNKTCRHYRDQARHKISFTAFGKGDLALFLPTRNANTRPWMAYNVATPHHFLKVPKDKAEGWRARDSIVARITGTDEAVAGDVSAGSGMC